MANESETERRRRAIPARAALPGIVFVAAYLLLAVVTALLPDQEFVRTFLLGEREQLPRLWVGALLVACFVWAWIRDRRARR
jgi:protein-S-isoprenylcysteine O-methyltransferase Ste14